MNTIHPGRRTICWDTQSGDQSRSINWVVRKRSVQTRDHFMWFKYSLYVTFLSLTVTLFLIIILVHRWPTCGTRVNYWRRYVKWHTVTQQYFFLLDCYYLLYGFYWIYKALWRFTKFWKYVYVKIKETLENNKARKTSILLQNNTLTRIWEAIS